jgi:acyl-coenzyme A synthetase/AMP-(fatty) acid ligase
VFAANYIWHARELLGEQLVLVVHPEQGKPVTPDIVANISERNRRLLNYKRVSSYLVWDADFPRTASTKIRRIELAEQIRKTKGRETVVPL